MSTTTADVHPDSLNGPAPTPLEPAPNVIVALSRVMAELPAIGKTMESPQGYQYRGIEQITQHAQPLFAKHGVVLAPHRIAWSPVTNLTINGRPWTDEKLLVTYRCYGPGGDFIEIEVPGIGRDNADKGSNKAMTQAFKYAMLQALCIADAKDDTDGLPHPGEADAPNATPTGPSPASREQIAKIREVCAQVRERGTETTETNDVGEVSVLGVPLLAYHDEHLVPVVSATDATALLARLADLLLDDAPAPAEAPSPPDPAPAPEPPETPAEREPGEREQAARAALERVGATTDAPPPTSRRDTKGQLKPREGESDREARMRQRVNSLHFQDVHDQLAALGMDVNGRPQAVRQRLLDHLLAQVAAAQKGGSQ